VSLYSFCQWLNETAISTGIREGDYSFPIIETVHILGLGFSVGTILWLDLRLMGLIMKNHRITDMVKVIEGRAILGTAVMMISGFLLLLAEPLKCYEALSFRLKAAFLILAGLNVLYFHRKVYSTVAEWDESPNPPFQAKLVGAVSMVGWLAVIIFGRWTAYR